MGSKSLCKSSDFCSCSEHQDVPFQEQTGIDLEGSIIGSPQIRRFVYKDKYSLWYFSQNLLHNKKANSDCLL